MEHGKLLLPMEGLVRSKQILTHYPVSVSHLYAEMHGNRFPKQRLHRGRAALWDVTEFRAFLADAGVTLL